MIYYSNRYEYNATGVEPDGSPFTLYSSGNTRDEAVSTGRSHAQPGDTILTEHVTHNPKEDEA